MASSLAFYGALALAGLALAGVYFAGTWFGHGDARSHAAGNAQHVAGSHNARALDMVLQHAALRHDAWIALVIGLFVFIAAVAGSALQMQRAIDTIWDVDPKSAQRSEAKAAGLHVPQFLGIYALTMLLIVLLFAGAAVHGLAHHTHHLPALRGILYQALDVGASIVLLTFVFLMIFAYLPPVDIPWRKVWLGAFLSAVLYERGQFGLALYFGEMDATSPYADAGAVLAVLVWLYYSAQVVLVGADFTKVLSGGAQRRGKRNTRAA